MYASFEEIIDSAGYEPLTNGDRIRAMSDEELAEALSNAIHCRTCYARNVCKISADSNCQQDHLTWLKQPVEEKHG